MSLEFFLDAFQGKHGASSLIGDCFGTLPYMIWKQALTAGGPDELGLHPENVNSLHNETLPK